MKHLNKLKFLQTTLIVSALSLSFLSGCRSKIDVGEICVSLESPGFYCANQKVPSQKEGFSKPYKPNYICQEADQYNKLIDQLAKLQSEIAQYKWQGRN